LRNVSNGTNWKKKKERWPPKSWPGNGMGGETLGVFNRPKIVRANPREVRLDSGNSAAGLRNAPVK